MFWFSARGQSVLMFVALAKNLGCKVTIAGRRAARLEAAKKLGASQVIDIGDGKNLVEKIRAESKTRFDAVIEAVGKPETWEAAVQLVRKGGVVNFFGGCPSGTTVSLDTELIHYSNLTLLASFHHTPRTIRRALEFIEAGVIRAADFVDGECPLTQLPELFKSMSAGNSAIKTLIRPHESDRIILRLQKIFQIFLHFFQVRQVDIHHVAGVEFGVGDVACGKPESSAMWSSA